MRAAQHATIWTVAARKKLWVTSLIVLEVFVAALLLAMVWGSGYYLKSLFDMANLNLHRLIRLSPVTPGILMFVGGTVILSQSAE